MDAKFLKYCIDTAVVSQDALRRALLMADDGTSIYDILIHQIGVSQEQLAIAAGEFYECPVVDLLRVHPEPAATAYGSAVMCHRLGFFPFSIDPVAGVLVAIADYTQTDDIANYLRESKIERMKFYIAPLDTLSQAIDHTYAPQHNNELSRSGNRRDSVLRTQYFDIELADTETPFPNAGNSHFVQELSKELEICKDENAQLKQRVEQLSSSLDLEMQMMRKLVQLLASKGSIDGDSIERWLSSQR